VNYISILTNTTVLIPETLIRLIGSAQSIGRPKWEKLGSLIHDRALSASQQTAVDHLVATPGWIDADSDKRFSLVLEAFDQSSRALPEVTEVAVGDGVIVSAKRSGPTTKISIPDQRIPGLSAWLLQRLPALVEEFQGNQQRGADMT
jgi:ParB family transcriptional regulator, chromosome partitioning protein